MAKPAIVENSSAPTSVRDILGQAGVISDDGRIAEEVDLVNDENQDEEINKDEETLNLEDKNDEESSEKGEDEDESTGEVDEEAVEIDSSVLASVLGIDESEITLSEDGSPLFTAKVDGKTQEISLDSLLRNFRLQQHVDNKATTLNEQQVAFDAEVVTARDNYKVITEQTILILSEQEKDIQTEMEKYDWTALEDKDPSAYLITREKFKDKLFKLQSQRQKVIESYNQEYEKAANEYNANRIENINKEAKLLVDALPEWKNEAIAKTQSLELRTYALEVMKFTEAEILELVDHRAWIGIRKAMLFDKMTSSASTTSKKVVKLPKVVIRKSTKSPVTKSKATLANKKEAAKSGNASDQLAFITEILK